jgi:hypothetical protein
LVERDKLPKISNAIFVDIDISKSRKFNSFYQNMINGRPYNIVGGIWS